MTGRKTITLIFFCIVIPLTIYLILPSEKTKIKKLIKKGAESIEKEDISSVMSFISFNYRDDYGFNYLYLKDGFKKFFESYSDIEVGYKDLKINIDESKRNATAKIDVWILITSDNNTGYILGNITEPIHITLHLVKEKFKWQVTKAKGIPLE